MAANVNTDELGDLGLTDVEEAAMPGSSGGIRGTNEAEWKAAVNAALVSQDPNTMLMPATALDGADNPGCPSS